MSGLIEYVLHGDLEVKRKVKQRWIVAAAEQVSGGWIVQFHIERHDKHERELGTDISSEERTFPQCSSDELKQKVIDWVREVAAKHYRCAPNAILFMNLIWERD